MPLNENLYTKLIKPFIVSAVPRKKNKITRSSRFDNFEYKYQYIDNMVDYALTQEIGYHYNAMSEGPEKFNEYMKEIINLPLPLEPEIISERVIKYVVIHYMTYTPYNKKELYIADFIINLINDKLVDPNIMLNIVFEYGEHMNSCAIIETLLPLCKLTIEQMDEFAKHYKNGDMDIINHFVNWGIQPTANQINSLIFNKNKFDDKFLKQFNVQITPGYIIACVGAGHYNIPGLRPKQKMTLTESEKKDVSINIFNNNFSKAQAEALRKQFDLTFDVDCMMAMCKHGASIPIFNYLVDMGIKPSLECICHLIPNYCSHGRVRKILEKCLE